MKPEDLIKESASIFKNIETMSLSDKIDTINKIRLDLKQYSPFATEPVDCVVWIKNDGVKANDYNPNSVAPPEMALLERSIDADGYTQPIVAWDSDDDEKLTVIDGFHRHRVGKESDLIRERVHGYLPVVVINKDRSSRKDRMASTIRHNRARGKHNVDSMTDIVVELRRRNWSDKKISKELGMDPDEVLRLCQMSGLQEMFSDVEFTNSWDIDIMTEDDIEFILSEENIDKDKEPKPDRILHTYENWECHKAGFYETKPPEGMTKDECEEKYADFLRDIPMFEFVLSEVIEEWVNSCEHYLTNDTMNRVAWLGQACLCKELGIPAAFRSGYNQLSKDEKYNADKMALEYLNIWLVNNGRDRLPEDYITFKPKADIY